VIRRGESYVLYSDNEIRKKLRTTQSLRVLKQLQEFFEARSHREALERVDCDPSGAESAEVREFHKLIEETRRWLTPPLRIVFNRNHEKKP